MPSPNQVTRGTCFCASGAKLYGTPCRNSPYSPSDSPWSLMYSSAVSYCFDWVWSQSMVWPRKWSVWAIELS
ncbi:hypothetical protein D9M72_267490 [compost metagenome]